MAKGEPKDRRGPRAPRIVGRAAARGGGVRGSGGRARAGEVDGGRVSESGSGAVAGAAGGGAGGIAGGVAGGVYVLSRAALRQVDRLCVEQFGLPSIVLMENAAAQLCAATLDLLPMGAGREAGGVLIFCGHGNNGGDGLALARHLHNAGVRVGVLLAAPPAEFKGDAAVQLGVVRRMGIRLAVVDPADPAHSAEVLGRDVGRMDVVVDALLGTGLDRPVMGVLADLIAVINLLRQAGEGGIRVVAADLPSGLDADTGEALAVPPHGAVRADVTVSFVGMKQGFGAAEAAEYLGEVMIADIGAPRELVYRLGRRADRFGAGGSGKRSAASEATGGAGRGSTD